MPHYIQAERAPKPKGPYSQAVVCHGKHIYVSGQGPVDPETGNFVGSSFEEQAVRTFENLKIVLGAAGASLKDIVKINVYLTDMDNFSKLNELYQRYFTEPYPSRTTVHSALVGFMIEVDGIAVLSDSNNLAERA